MAESPLAPLVGQRLRFVAFVRKRVADDATAEDIVQAAFARATTAASDLRSPDDATAWFFSILRNAIVDHHRRRAAAESAIDKLANEPRADTTPPRHPICGCVFKVLPSLRQEYEAIIRAVDVEGRAVEDVARQLGITANNASVRLHRARGSLKGKLLEFCVDCCTDASTAGCRDCYCHD
jgi:RNA polymerase sigma-70 factor (ECF subfamily)